MLPKPLRPHEKQAAAVAYHSCRVGVRLIAYRIRIVSHECTPVERILAALGCDDAPVERKKRKILILPERDFHAFAAADYADLVRAVAHYGVDPALREGFDIEYIRYRMILSAAESAENVYHVTAALDRKIAEMEKDY